MYLTMQQIIEEKVNKNIRMGILYPLGIMYVHNKTMNMPITRKTNVSFLSEIKEKN